MQPSRFLFERLHSRANVGLSSFARRARLLPVVCASEIGTIPSHRRIWFLSHERWSCSFTAAVDRYVVFHHFEIPA